MLKVCLLFLHFGVYLSANFESTRKLFAAELFNRPARTPPHRSYLSSFEPPPPRQNETGAAQMPVWRCGSVQIERVYTPVRPTRLVVAVCCVLQDSFSSLQCICFAGVRGFWKSPRQSEQTGAVNRASASWLWDAPSSSDPAVAAASWDLPENNSRARRKRCARSSV